MLAAGLKIVLSKGYNGTSVQEIANSVGLPKGSFYNYFESKEVFGASIVSLCDEMATHRKVLNDKMMPPLVRLRLYFEKSTAIQVESNFEYGSLLGKLSAEMASQSPLIREKLAALFQTWARDIENAVRQAQAEGNVGTRNDASLIATFLLDAYEGAILRSQVEKSRLALDIFSSIAFDTILI